MRVQPEIDIKPLKKTKYKDNLGNNLYSKNVSVDVSITDTKSGLKTIEYYVDAENNKIEKKMIQLSNEGYKEGDKLEDGWIVTKTDRNLVVKVSRKIFLALTIMTLLHILEHQTWLGIKQNILKHRNSQ